MWIKSNTTIADRGIGEKVRDEELDVWKGRG